MHPLSQRVFGHDENATDFVLLGFLRFTVLPANTFEVIASFKAHDLCVRMKYDIRTLQPYESGSVT
jgi:hypothetical protein